jgi:hypothetical protein
VTGFEKCVTELKSYAKAQCHEDTLLYRAIAQQQQHMLMDIELIAAMLEQFLRKCQKMLCNQPNCKNLELNFKNNTEVQKTYRRR